MFKNLRPYPTHEDRDGAQLPSQWQSRRLKSMISLATGDAITQASIEVSGRYAVYGGNGRRGNTRNFNQLADTIVIGRVGAQCGNVHLAHGPFWASEHALVVGTRTDLVAEWLAHCLRTMNLGQYAIGSAQPVLTSERLLVLRALIPPIEEQAAIVRYLAHAHARIDRAIAAKRKLIALLEEQKQANINQAVTRGLDPTAPLKDTGIPWLGEVSAHWETWPLGRLAGIGNGSTPARSNPEYWSGGHYPWLNSSYANQDRVKGSDQFVTATALAECHLPIVQPGSILIAITGQGKTRGKAALLEIEATINQHLAYITPRPDLADPAFLQRSLQAAYRELRRISDDSGSTKGALTCQDLKSFRVPLPPLQEQRAIVAHVDSENATTEAAIDRAIREIDLLREFRTRLTSDVVTGQVDVRHIAATLPDLDPDELTADVSAIEDDLVDEAAEFLEDVDS